MDNLVSVPVTHPCRFLQGQRDQNKTIKSPEPDPPVRRPAKKTQRDDPPVTHPALQSAIKSPEDSVPVIPKRRPTPKRKKLTQEWLEF